jgi:hypothetical protein
MIMDRNTCLTTSRRRSASSASRVRPKRFIRTLKENLLWVRTFETIEELRQALLEEAVPLENRRRYKPV